MVSSCIKCKHHGLSIDDLLDVDDNVAGHNEQEGKHKLIKFDSDSEASNVVK